MYTWIMTGGPTLILSLSWKGRYPWWSSILSVVVHWGSYHFSFAWATFSSSKHCSYLSFCWIWNELLNQCTSCEKLFWSMHLSFWFFKFNIYCFSTWFKKAESWVVQIRINKLCDNIIQQFHRNLLMIWMAKEDFVTVFENYFKFDSNCENNHGHYEVHKDLSAGVLAFVWLLNLWYRDKQLFHMIFIKR